MNDALSVCKLSACMLAIHFNKCPYALEACKKTKQEELKCWQSFCEMVIKQPGGERKLVSLLDTLSAYLDYMKENEQVIINKRMLS